MDLQAAHMMRGKRSLMSKATTGVCFALACALLIGSLVTSGKANPNFRPGSSPSLPTTELN